MIEIRAAEPADAAPILSFIRKLAEYERLQHEVTATQTDIVRDLFGPDPRVFCDIALWDGVPAGFAFWFYNYSTFRGRHGIYLEDLFVEPVYRGRGIGKALLARLAQRCQAEDLGRLEWSVLDWNTPSIDFYKSLGAEPMGDWTIFRLTGSALGRLGEPRVR